MVAIMSTFAEVNAATLAYQAAMADSAAKQAASDAARAALEATIASEQAIIDAAIAHQSVRAAEEQTALDAVDEINGQAYFVLNDALLALNAAVAAYVPPGA
jgi:hypothetical protein